MLLGDLALSREEILQLFRVDHGKRSDYRTGLSSPSPPWGRGNQVWLCSGPDRLDQARGGSIVATYRRFAPEFGQDRLGELLAQLDAPLVEGVDVPHDPLDEDLVLVE